MHSNSGNFTAGTRGNAKLLPFVALEKKLTSTIFHHSLTINSRLRYQQNEPKNYRVTYHKKNGGQKF
jgi:hypothetical protein